MRRIAILDAPSNLGLRPPTETSVPGCAKAPGALRDHDLVARLAARDAGCLTPPRYDPGNWRPGDGVCHAEQIAAYSVALADRIGSIIDAGEFPVVLGGDCSILLGSALAMHRLGDVVGGRIGLVFVDGHSDFRHPGNASYVGAAAGEDLALATGRGQADLAGIEGRRPYFRDIDVVVLGIRAQDEYRLDLQAAGIITRPVPALRVEGAARTAQWARDQLSDCAGYWVHIDVDVLDPAVMPAVDAPDPGGIAFAELELLLSGLVDTPRCLGVEITVFDPDYDPDGAYAAEIVETVVAGLAPVRMADPIPAGGTAAAAFAGRSSDSEPAPAAALAGPSSTSEAEVAAAPVAALGGRSSDPEAATAPAGSLARRAPDSAAPGGPSSGLESAGSDVAGSRSFVDGSPAPVSGASPDDEGSAPAAARLSPRVGGLAPAAGGLAPAAGGLSPAAAGPSPDAGASRAGELSPGGSRAGGLSPAGGLSRDARAPRAGGLAPAAGGLPPSGGGLSPGAGAQGPGGLSPMAAEPPAEIAAPDSPPLAAAPSDVEDAAPERAASPSAPSVATESVPAPAEAKPAPVAPSARKPSGYESGAAMTDAAATRPAAHSAASGSAAATVSGSGEGSSFPPLLVDSAAAEVLAASAAAAGIRKPPAAREAPDDEPAVSEHTDEGKPEKSEVVGDAEAEPGPAGRSLPERDLAGRFKAASDSGSRKGGLDPSRRAKDEAASSQPGPAHPESRPREPDRPDRPAPARTESDSMLRRKAESAWMDVAADLAARRGTPAERAARRATEAGPLGLPQEAGDLGPAKLRRGGEAEKSWKDDEPKPPADEGHEVEAPARDEEAPSPRPGGGRMAVPAFEPFGPPAKAGPGRLRRHKKGSNGEIA